LIPFGDKVFKFSNPEAFPFLYAFIIPLGVMVNYGDLQFPEIIMVSRRSEMSAEWKVRFAISIASVAIQAFTKFLFNFSVVLKATNCTFQEVDNIFRLAVGIAVYDEFFSCMYATEFLCALDVYTRHTSSRITFLALTIVGRSRGDVSSHQDIFQTFGFSESQDGWFFEDFAQLWVFLYGCSVLTNDVG
jgi:hypothetical protein